jgi:hypothetical protein
MHLHAAQCPISKLFRRCSDLSCWRHASTKNRGTGGAGILPRQRTKNLRPHCISRASLTTRRVGSNRSAASSRFMRSRKVKPWRLYRCRGWCTNGTPCTTRLATPIPNETNGRVPIIRRPRAYGSHFRDKSSRRGIDDSDQIASFDSASTGRRPGAFGLRHKSRLMCLPPFPAQNLFQSSI